MGMAMNLPTQKPTGGSYVNRFFGGPPLSVIFRLALLSILIGVILQAVGARSLEHHRQPATARAVRLGHGLRRPALALALPAPGRRSGGADLARRAAPARRPRSVIRFGPRRSCSPKLATLAVRTTRDPDIGEVLARDHMPRLVHAMWAA
jgi:hypothetical protein